MPRLNARAASQPRVPRRAAGGAAKAGAAQPGGAKARVPVERVQTGLRIEKRMLKVLKALAEYHDITLGDLVEGIVLHAFDGKAPFSRASLERIRELKRIYGMNLDASHAHRLADKSES